MKEIIDALVELQHVDDDVSVHAVQREDLSENLQRLRAILERMGHELEDKRDKLTEAQRFYNEKHVDLQADAERLAKAKGKLAGVSRTKEYAAMQRELDNLRKKYSEDEAELKRLSEAIEEYQTAISAQEGKLAELEAEVKRETSASSDQLSELDRVVTDISKRKEAIIVKLPANVVSRYNRVLKRREGKAVVPVLEGGQCTGCQMRLPPQQYIYVQRKEKLISCPTCQRYLFQPDEPLTAEDAEGAEAATA